IAAVMKSIVIVLSQLNLIMFYQVILSAILSWGVVADQVICILITESRRQIL
ncbi:MAG: hypothetical protein K0R55_3123, partial [Sporomusa sp.]|nr:hypothetical protein [Sporomusa sp.]